MRRLGCFCLFALIILWVSGCSSNAVTPEISTGSVSSASDTSSDAVSPADLISEFKFEQGQWYGNKYVNDCFSITYTRPENGMLVHAPDNYALTSEAPPQLADMDYVPDPELEYPDFTCLICEADPDYESNNSIGSSHFLSVTAENLTATDNLNITPKEYLEQMMFYDVDAMVLYAALSDESLTEWHDEYFIGGEKYSALHIIQNYDGGYYEEFWALRPVGDYMVIIFASRDAIDAMSVDSMIACFE